MPVNFNSIPNTDLIIVAFVQIFFLLVIISLSWPLGARSRVPLITVQSYKYARLQHDFGTCTRV